MTSKNVNIGQELAERPQHELGCNFSILFLVPKVINQMKEGFLLGILVLFGKRGILTLQLYSLRHSAPDSFLRVFSGIGLELTGM
jgi:hypothetical protein